MPRHSFRGIARFVYRIEMTMPLRSSENSRPVCQPRRLSTTPFSLRSRAAFLPVTTARPASAWPYVPTISPALCRLEAVPTRTALEAPIDDPHRLELHGRSTVLMHGDTLCTEDLDYQNWRRIARSAEWQREFLSLPLAQRHQRVQALRERSSRAILAKPAEIMDVNDGAVREAMRTHDVDLLIHGHTHRPAHHRLEVDGKPCERWVLPEWYGRGGYLVAEAGGLRLETL